MTATMPKTNVKPLNVRKAMLASAITLLVLALIVGGILLLRRNPSEEIVDPEQFRDELVQELTDHHGEYDERSIVLTGTNKATAKKLAEKLGADLTIDPLTEDVKAILAAKGIDRIACVIECVGKVATMKQAIDIAGKKSIVMLFGLTAPGDEMTIKPFEIFKKEITLKASFINPYTQKRALDLIDGGKIDVSSMVYACESLDKLSEILADGALRAKGKFIITP